MGRWWCCAGTGRPNSSGSSQSTTGRWSSTSSGSVSTRASKYSLCSRACGDIPSCGFQDGQHGHGPPEMEQPAPVGGNVLMVAGARAEKVAELVVGLAEPGG